MDIGLGLHDELHQRLRETIAGVGKEKSSGGLDFEKLKERRRRRRKGDNDDVSCHQYDHTLVYAFHHHWQSIFVIVMIVNNRAS